MGGAESKVFIHRSIKTRIETNEREIGKRIKKKFLYIDPLKQGLKLDYINEIETILAQFLYIDPLKQGLKQPQTRFSKRFMDWFLYIDPLKQGLKLPCR